MEEYNKEKILGQHLWARGYFCATVGSVTEETLKRYLNILFIQNYHNH